MPSIPYVVGQWVRGEKFYGRASLLEEILSGHRNWIWLLGTRRIGKTSTLKQLELLTSNAPENGRFPVFWDLQGAEDPEELNRGFNEALLDAEERLSGHGIDPKEMKGADLFESLGRLRRRLRGSGLKLLLLCDEAEELINLNRKDPALLGKLRHALQAGEDIRSVMASTIRLWALAEQRGDTSPFLHGFTPPLYISRMGDDEARALIRQEKLPGAARPALPESVVEEIRAKCDNHPYLIQMVCKRYQECGDLPEAIEEVAAEKMVSFFFSVDFEMLSQVERDVLRTIAERSAANSESILNTIEADPGELRGILLGLENLGYIRRNAERRFELVNHFFRKWFLTQGISRPPVSGAVSDRPAGPPDPGARSSAGTVLPEILDGRYRLLEKVGEGSAGVVYRAHDDVLGSTIAVKILKPEYSAHADLLERLRREILLSQDLIHANILPIYHLGDCLGRKYLTMKFVNGPTLAKFIAERGPLEVPRVVETGCKLASTLEAAHNRHVIHRDIKPQNILLDERDEPYLTDFGLARLLTGPAMTRSGIFLGTPYYSSPEQAKLQPADERSDLYSLGVVLFEMATGKRPFNAGTSRAVLDMHCSEPAPDPRGLRPALPRALSKLILRCLEKDPARRHQTAQALRLELERCRSG